MKDNHESDLNCQCMMPSTDTEPYDKKWFYKQQGIEYEKGLMIENV